MTVLKLLATLGLRGAQVRVQVERLASGVEVVRIHWREGGRKRTRSWPNAAETRRIAKATAEGMVDRLQRGGTVRVRISLGDLSERYITAKQPEWRPATLRFVRAAWRLLHAALPPETYADLVTPEVLDELRQKLRTGSRGVRTASQIAAHITQVKAVFAFGFARKLLADNPLATYRVRLSKNDQAQNVEEYHPAEAAAILATLSYRDRATWRAWAAITLAGLLGCRQRALLHLERADVDLTRRTVRWRAELDKLGRERVQPLPRAAVFTVRVCDVWRRRANYAGPFVFFGADRRTRGRGAPYAYAGLNYQLHEAERRAGIARKPFRAMHGLRRMAAKNVLVLSGDLNAVGEWIGDTDLRVLKRSYLKERPEELRAIADRMDTAISSRSGDRKANGRKPRKRATIQPLATEPLMQEPQVGIEPTTARKKTIVPHGKRPRFGPVSAAPTDEKVAASTKSLPEAATERRRAAKP